MKLNIAIARVSLLSAILFSTMFIVGGLSSSFNIFGGILRGTEHIFLIGICVLVFASFVISGLSFIKYHDKMSLRYLIYSIISLTVIVLIIIFIIIALQDLFAF